MRFSKSVRNLVTTVFCGALLIALTPISGAEEGTAAPNPALLDPSLATAKAPDTYKVAMESTAGNFVIEVHRDWRRMERTAFTTWSRSATSTTSPSSG